MTRLVNSAALILFAAMLFAGCSQQSPENSPPINRDMVAAPVDPETLVKPVEIENTTQLSLENFNRIKNGMSLLDVEILIAGKSRKVTSKTENNKKKETYRWETKDGSKYIEVSFEDEKVVGKNQKGLK